jgi:hypothetical protein
MIPKRNKINPENSYVATHRRAIISSSYSQGFLFGGSKMEEEVFLCTCGCGRIVNFYRGRPNKFIQGHTMKGRKHSEETKRRMRVSNKNFLPEVREKISVTGKGRIVSEETRKKLSKAHTGKKLSKEHKLKLSLAKLERSRKMDRLLTAEGYCHIWGDREYVDSIRKGACEDCGITNMMSIKLFGHKLCTHHTEGKEDCAPEYIETLCNSCHARLHNNLRWGNTNEK